MYFAGSAVLDCLKGLPILKSFWYRKEALIDMQYTDNFFLDSGAYSAFTQNDEIAVEEYAAFLHEYKDKITTAASLDAIGDAKKSYVIYKLLTGTMECDVIPVFHCREDISWLVKYLDMDVPYIALGGMVPETTKWLYGWLDNLWENYLTDSKGKPRLKVHGFGLTVASLMERYPWYSADSTTWLVGSRFGNAVVNYPGRSLAQIPISLRHPTVKKGSSNHIKQLSTVEVNWFMQQLEKSGISNEELTLYTEKLLEFNVWTFRQWEKNKGFPKRFTATTQKGLFDA